MLSLSFFRSYKLSDSCELKCAPCELWRRENEEEYLPAEAVLAEFKQLRWEGAKLLHIYGGDPLLHPQIEIILAGAKRLGFLIILSTPGIHYQKFPKGLQEYVDLLVLLLHHADQLEHDQIAGERSFERILEALEYARENKVPAMLSFLLTRDNIQALPDMYALAEAHNVLAWFNPLPAAYAVEGFSADSLEHLKYYGRKKYGWSHLPAIDPKHFKNLDQRQDCLIRDELWDGSFERFNLRYLMMLFSMAQLFWKILSLKKA